MSDGRSELLGALTVAMAMVPLLYSRNRMFQRFNDPVVKKARSRARMVRSLLRFVAREDASVSLAQSPEGHMLRYRLPRLRLDRAVRLTDLELAVLRVLLAKGPHPSMLAEQTDDRARVEASLAILPQETATERT
jgi:hypothetical protein